MATRRTRSAPLSAVSATPSPGKKSPGKRAKSEDGSAVTSQRPASFTAPGLSSQHGQKVASRLQERLVGLIDLSLTLKHIHWNVVGPHFIAVHLMLDPQHDGVETMVDELAERIATLGGVPSGLPGRIVDARTWTDYRIDRADAIAHMGALDLVYQSVIEDHRAAITAVGDMDPISEDVLIGQTRTLEQYHWFVRSHLLDHAGGVSNAGAASELDAARAVVDKQRRVRRSADAAAQRTS